MFSFIAIVVLVTGASAAVVPSLNMPRPNSTLHLSAPTARKASRIINGEEADFGDFPHQLTLVYYGSHICGASLLSAEWAITAAHCVDGLPPNSLAVAGNFIDFNNLGQYFYSGIAQIRMHNRYNVGDGGFPNDIAVIRLSSPVDNSARYAIEVAKPWSNVDNADCYISGWGLTEENGAPNKLQKSKVSVLSNADCNIEWESTTLIQDQHICVRGEDHPDRSGSCNGDSGGPLTCDGVLAGVTSWGRSGCHVNGYVTHPSVYVRTSYFYDWIRNNCNNCIEPLL